MEKRDFQKSNSQKAEPLMGGVLQSIAGGVRAPTTTFPPVHVHQVDQGTPDGMDG